MKKNGNTVELKKHGVFKLNELGIKSATTDFLKLCIPESAEIYNSEIVISWWELEEPTGYKVIIKNMFDEPIIEEFTEKPFVKLNFDQLELRNESFFILSILSSSNPSLYSMEYGLMRLKGVEKDYIRGKLKELNIPEGLESAEIMLKYAEFYEKYDLLVDALTYYLYAIEKEPDKHFHEVALGNFLGRNGLAR